MRIVSWNCLKGIGKKQKEEFIRSLNPDILILQESRESDFNSVMNRVWVTNKNKRTGLGMGVYFFNRNISFRTLPMDTKFEVVVPIEIQFNGGVFVLVAVWAFNRRSVGEFKGKRGMMGEALKHYKDLLGSKSCWIGDFNNGPEINKGITWATIRDLFTESGMQKIIFSQDCVTFRRGEKKLEIDHCFLGNELYSRSTWPDLSDATTDLSDHVPLIVDLEI